MAKPLEIDFVQMPWSKSAASWRYHELEVWNALQQAVSDGGRLLVDGNPSANDHLSGALEVSPAGFSAKINISACEGTVPAVGARTRSDAQRYFKDQDVHIEASGDAIAVTIRAPFADDKKGRIERVLGTLWSLQLFAVRILEEAAASPPDADGSRPEDAQSRT